MANKEEALVDIAGLGRLKPKKCQVINENEVKARKWNDEGKDLLINKMHAGSTSLSISRKLSLVIPVSSIISSCMILSKSSILSLLFSLSSSWSSLVYFLFLYL